MNNRWKILIITADGIRHNYYPEDLDNKYFTFINVSQSSRLTDSRFDVVNASDIPGYQFLGRDWAESEVFYNIFRLDLFPEYDYLGFMHSDFDIRSSIRGDFTEIINNALIDHDFIQFRPSRLYNIIDKNNLQMDPYHPQKTFGRGLNGRIMSGNPYIINIINRYTHSRFNIDMFPKDTSISLCSAIMTRRKRIVDIGHMISDMKDSGDIDLFCMNNKTRYPGNLSERIISFYSALFPNKYDLPIRHYFNQTSRGK